MALLIIFKLVTCGLFIQWLSSPTNIQGLTCGSNKKKWITIRKKIIHIIKAGRNVFLGSSWFTKRTQLYHLICIKRTRDLLTVNWKSTVSTYLRNIFTKKDPKHVPLLVSTSRSFPRSWLVTGSKWGRKCLPLWGSWVHPRFLVLFRFLCNVL